MATFYDMIMMFERLGFSDIVLPFILIFTLVFAVLQYIKLFPPAGVTDDKEIRRRTKKFHMAIASVMAMAVVIPHLSGSYPQGYDVVDIINSALPNVSVVAIAIIGALLILGLFNINLETKQKDLFGGLLFVLALGLIIYIFGASAGWGWSIPNWLGFLKDKDTTSLIIIILVFALILKFITKPELNEKDAEKARQAKLNRTRTRFEPFWGDKK